MSMKQSDAGPWGYKVTITAYVEGSERAAALTAQIMEGSAPFGTAVGTRIDVVESAPTEQGAA